MNTPVVQLGILGLAAKSMPASPAAPGVFAKVLTGTMQSLDPAANGGVDPGAVPSAGGGASQDHAILVNGSKTSGPVARLNTASKRNPGLREEGLSLPLPNISSSVVQNPPVAQTLPLNGPVASSIKSGPETPSTNQHIPVFQSGNQSVSVDGVPASSLPPSEALTTAAVKPAIGNVPATNRAESVVGNTSATDTLRPVMGNASPDDKTRLKTEVGPQVGDPSMKTPDANVDKPAPSEKSSGGQFQVPKEFIEKTSPETDIELRTLPGQSTKAQTTAGLATRTDNPQTTRNTAGTGESDPAHAASASASPAPKQSKQELQAVSESRANSPIATDGSPITDSVAMQVMVSPPNSSDLIKGNTGNASKSPLPAVGKNSPSQVSSTAKDAVTHSAANEPQANVKDANKVRKPEGVSQGGPDKDALAVKDVKTSPTDAGSAKVADTDRTQSVPVTNKTAAQELPKSGSQVNAAGQPVSAAHDSDASETTYPFPGTLVNSAKLIERIGHTEMRVGIQSGELGNVDIRTALGKHQFTAEISVERGELGRLMASELPGLHSRLSEHQVPFPRVTIQEYSSGSSSTLEQRSREERRAPQMNSVPREESLRESGSGMFDAIAGTEAKPGSGIDLHM